MRANTNGVLIINNNNNPFETLEVLNGLKTGEKCNVQMLVTNRTIEIVNNKISNVSLSTQVTYYNVEENNKEIIILASIIMQYQNWFDHINIGDQIILECKLDELVESNGIQLARFTYE